ncbi:thioredoxin domain-containing protein [Vibrio coralliilyticus]|uniref:Thioredoxin domain-containing protein n=1 Tax=Vibrio coralliilyticus TaxID=190893 RepID=A0AAP6ZRI2_9VIBR|nr:thioredoxin domain-containing protein [Vibrio coralliilyticus]NOI32275.1 thioredoxin domain-containing protein [Vibrio coralliilyticus]NOJ25326.1 thioredoxin domain-containing protein [Vibrio coralliilyticus]
MENTTKTKLGFLAFGVALLVSNASIYYSLNQKASRDSLNETDGEVALLADRVIGVEGELGELTTLTLEDIDKFIMDNPEVVVKSLAKYRFEQEQLSKQKESERTESFMDQLYNDDSDPYFGNPNGKHVIVEFADYNCGHCKRLSPTLEQFVAIDPEAKVIMKEYPIFTDRPTSAYAALMATAVFYHKPQSYEAVHKAFMKTKLTREFIDQTIAKQGITKEDLQPHLDRAKRQIEKVRTLGAQLGVRGTPTVFVGKERRGANVTASQLKAMFTN